MKRIVIMGAGGRDFHDFNVAFRGDPDVEVVAFTATQIPGIANRTFPASIAGPRYPDGIPILDESELERLILEEHIDEVVFAYSDIPHEEVMHKASIVMARGADFRLVGPAASMIASTKPVVAVCAVRTGAGKSQTSRQVGRILSDAGLRVALVRHPMPYGDLESMRVQRFETIEDIDASNPTVEEREEYEAPVLAGMVMWAGVDYQEILKQAEQEADVIVWDGGNNDFPFFRPDLMITVADPLRPGHELAYHPGEMNVRMANIVVINKVDTADPDDVMNVIESVRVLNPRASIVQAASPVTLQDGPPIARKRVLVVEDGPTLTHGGMPYGAGTVAVRRGGADQIVDPRPYAVGSIARTYEKYPSLGPVLPAMGYGPEQLAELEETIQATPCDVVVTGTPIALERIIDMGHPTRHVTYESSDVGHPTLAETMAPFVSRALSGRRSITAHH